MENDVLETAMPRPYEHRLQVIGMVQDDYKSIVEISDASYRAYTVTHPEERLLEPETIIWWARWCNADNIWLITIVGLWQLVPIPEDLSVSGRFTTPPLAGTSRSKYASVIALHDYQGLSQAPMAPGLPFGLLCAASYWRLFYVRLFSRFGSGLSLPMLINIFQASVRLWRASYLNNAGVLFIDHPHYLEPMFVLPGH